MMGAADLIPDLDRASVEALSRAGLYVQVAATNLTAWRHGHPDQYLDAGHAAFRAIQHALAELRRARLALVHELARVTSNHLAAGSPPPADPAGAPPAPTTTAPPDTAMAGGATRSGALGSAPEPSASPAAVSGAGPAAGEVPQNSHRPAVSALSGTGLGVASLAAAGAREADGVDAGKRWPPTEETPRPPSGAPAGALSGTPGVGLVGGAASHALRALPRPADPVAAYADEVIAALDLQPAVEVTHWPRLVQPGPQPDPALRLHPGSLACDACVAELPEQYATFPTVCPHRTSAHEQRLDELGGT